MVKKILFILLVGLISYQSFSQGLVEEQGRKRSFAWIRSQDVTVSRYFIYQGDTIPFENMIDSLYLMVGDSALYTTPHHLDSVIATLAGGHDPVTIDSLGTVAGMYINNDQLLGMMQSGPTQNGWLSWDDWIAFNAKLSWVYHDGTMTGEGTYTNPLGIDTTKFITTIDDEPFSAAWDDDLNATSKNSIYDYLTSLSISGTNLSYAAGPAYITVYSSTGDDINLPLANQANAGLMGPLDKAKLDSLNYPVDTIYVTADAVFPIEYLYYNNDGTPVYVTDIPKPNGLFSGGLVTLQYGLSFAVSPAAYYINGDLYTSPSTTLSLDSPDATYNRIDLFVVDTLGQASVITGTPAANPQTPSYDPTSQIPLTSVLVLTNGSITNPGGPDITTEVVYNENIEWVAGYSGVVTDYNSTTEVQTGSISGDAGTMSNGDDLYFTNESDFSPADYDVFSMWLYLKESIDSRDNLSLQFFNDGIAVSNLYPLTFDHSNTTIWQNISMNVSDITFTSETFDEVKITYVPRKSTTTFAGLYIDYVIFQKNITPPTGDQTITLYGDVEGTGTTMILTEVIPDMVSSINGVTNDEDNIDLVEDGFITITPDDAANIIKIGTDTAALYSYLESIKCDLVCTDSILAIIKSYIDTISVVITNGDVEFTFDRTDCQDSIQMLASYFVASTLNLKEIVIETVPTTGGLVYNGTTLTGNDTLLVVNNELEHTLYYVSDTETGSEYYDSFDFKTYYASNTSYSNSFSVLATVSECVEDLLCFASDLTINQTRSNVGIGGCATSTIITPGDLSPYPEDLQNVVINTIPTTGLLTLGGVSVSIGDTLSVSASSFAANLEYVADENTTGAYLDTAIFETLCSVDGTPASGNIFIDVSECSLSCDTALATALSGNLIVVDTLPYTPVAEGPVSGANLPQSVAESDTFIFVAFIDSYVADYEYFFVYRYNKYTGESTSKQLSTTNSYCCDIHKKPSVFVTSQGTLLVAIEQLPSDNNHNSPVDIFRWENPADLDTYDLRIIGDWPDNPLCYPTPYEINGTVLYDARKFSLAQNSSPYRVNYKSSDDGDTFGTQNLYVNHAESGYAIYKHMLGNLPTNPSQTYVKIDVYNYNTENYKYSTLLKTDFTTYYALDGTSLGTEVSKTELEDNRYFGSINLDGDFYKGMTSKLIGDTIITLLKKTVNGTTTLNFITTDINTGVSTTHSDFTTTLDYGWYYSNFYNIEGTLYMIAPYNGSKYYLKVNDDLSGVEQTCYDDTEIYADATGVSMYSELVAYYTPSSNTVKIYRMQDPDSITFPTCSVTEILANDSVQVDSTMQTLSFVTEGVTAIDTSIGLPTGVTASFASDTLKIDGSPSETGTFNYSIKLTGNCIPIYAQGTITVIDSLFTSTLFNGLVAVWELDETSGTIAYDSYGNNDGIYVNVNLDSIGLFGSAAYFNGTSAYVDLGDSLTEGYTAFSISAWVNFESYASGDSFLRKWAAGNQSFITGVSTNNSEAIYAAFKETTAYTQKRTTNNVNATGVWMHVVITWGGADDVAIYVNGSSESLITDVVGSPTELNTNDEHLGIGARYNLGSPDSFFNGKMQQVIIWDRAITSSEVTELNNNMNGKKMTNW